MAKKTLKLKKPGASMEAPLPQDTPVGGAQGVVAVMPLAGGSAGKTASYTASGIAGLIAVILLGVLLVLQFMENSEYKGAIPTRGFVAPPTAE